MAVRTDSDAVKKVLAPGRDYDTRKNPDLTPFIDTAAALVDDCVAMAADKGVPLASARQELIERWLAAHYYKQSDLAFASKSTEGASASFGGQLGMGLKGTRYGLTALQLDTTGCLAVVAEGEPKIAGGFWAGTTDSEATPWRSRN